MLPGVDQRTSSDRLGCGEAIMDNDELEKFKRMTIDDLSKLSMRDFDRLLSVEFDGDDEFADRMLRAALTQQTGVPH
jgi:hypothetical protein